MLKQEVLQPHKTTITPWEKPFLNFIIPYSWNNFSRVICRYQTSSKHSQKSILIGVTLALSSLATPQESVLAKTPYSIQVGSNPNRTDLVIAESQVFDGSHTITAQITNKRGETENISRTFSVANPKTQAQKYKPSNPIPPEAKTSFPLLFMSNFEQGDLGGWHKEICCGDAVQSVSVPVRSGNFALKFHLRKNDPDVMGGRRAELALRPVPAKAERWYGFSIFLPDTWAADPVTDIVAQWHEYPDFSKGESWRSPPLFLFTKDGSWRIGRIWDPNPVTLKNTPGPGGGTERIDLGNYAVGVWTDWIVHVKWSYQTDGLLEIWKNGNLVIQRTGPNTYNDKVGPYFKIGIYKPDWKYKPEKSTTETRTIYFDEVRIGHESNSYIDIAPP